MSSCLIPWFDLNTLDNFPGEYATQALDTLKLSRAAAPRHHVQREPGYADGEPCLLLMWQIRGTATLEQHGALLSVGAGDMVLHDAGHAYRLRFDSPFEVMVMRIPAVPMRSLCPMIDVLLGAVQHCRHPQVALLTAMADCHAGIDYAALPKAAAQHAAEAMRQTLAACALGILVNTHQRQAGLTRYHLDRIRRYALKRIGDSGLSINELVEALDISAAHIHRLFAGEAQSFSTWLWDTRLQLCHLALRNPEYRSQSISQIAYRFGYSHAAHFSRAYRKRFGMTPSAWRAGAAAAPAANTATATAAED